MGRPRGTGWHLLHGLAQNSGKPSIFFEAGASVQQMRHYQFKHAGHHAGYTVPRDVAGTTTMSAHLTLLPGRNSGPPQSPAHTLCGLPGVPAHRLEALGQTPLMEGSRWEQNAWECRGSLACQRKQGR
jgi:hypothetical protein